MNEPFRRDHEGRLHPWPTADTPTTLTAPSEALLREYAPITTLSLGTANDAEWFKRTELHNKLAAIEAAAAERATAPLMEALDIVSRHTHQGIWAMTMHAGADPVNDCYLCRALVKAGVLTLDDIGVGTRTAILARPAEEPQEPTEADIRTYRLDANDPEMRALNWAEWRESQEQSR